MSKRYADINVYFSIEFDDDGETDLAAQAYERLDEMLGSSLTLCDGYMGAEIVGPVRDTELPAQRPSDQNGQSLA